MVEDPAAAVVPDDELVRRVAGRDAEALAAVFRRHHAVVYRFALHLTGAAALAEDVTQEVFLAMMRDAGRYEPGRSTVAAWLCGIARNLTRQRLAQDRRIVPLPDGEETEEQAPGSPDRGRHGRRRADDADDTGGCDRQRAADRNRDRTMDVSGAERPGAHAHVRSALRRDDLPADGHHARRA
jgi:RNA polymerase sigma factor (sigma-70 family)